MSTVKPTAPWKASKRDRLRDALIFLATALFTFGVVEATPLKGKLAYFFLFIISYSVATAALSFFKYGATTAKDSAIKVVIAGGALLTVLPIASILATIIQKGYKGI
jgi:phosphate transport system permease protein